LSAEKTWGARIKNPSSELQHAGCHVHLYNAQVVNRVGWDGAIRPPDPNELGWKDTIRMNTRYYYRVAAFNTAGNSQYSPTFSVRTLN